MAQTVKNQPAMWETWVWSLGWENPLEKERATHSSILAWITPWTEELGDHEVAKSRTRLSTAHQPQSLLLLFLLNLKSIPHSLLPSQGLWSTSEFKNITNNQMKISLKAASSSYNLHHLFMPKALKALPILLPLLSYILVSAEESPLRLSSPLVCCVNKVCPGHRIFPNPVVSSPLLTPLSDVASKLPPHFPSYFWQFLSFADFTSSPPELISRTL